MEFKIAKYLQADYVLFVEVNNSLYNGCLIGRDSVSLTSNELINLYRLNNIISLLNDSGKLLEISYHEGKYILKIVNFIKGEELQFVIEEVRTNDNLLELLYEYDNELSINNMAYHKKI